MGWNFYNASGELQINDGGVQAASAVFTGKVDLGSNLLVGNAGSTGIAISANGEVTMAAQPLAIAYQASTASNVTGDNTVYTLGTTVDLTEITDQNADFVGTTGTFTAPVTGSYLVSASVELSSIDTATTGYRLQIIASNRTGTYFTQNLTNSGTTTVNAMNIGGAVIIDMDAADTFTIAVRVIGTNKIVDISGTGFDTQVGVMLLA
jgi:hypothetical protein